MKLIDQLSEEDRKLCESDDPNDHSKLLMKLLREEYRSEVPVREYKSISEVQHENVRTFYLEADEFLKELIHGKSDWKPGPLIIDGHTWNLFAIGRLDDKIVEVVVHTKWGDHGE